MVESCFDKRILTKFFIRGGYALFLNFSISTLSYAQMPTSLGEAMAGTAITGGAAATAGSAAKPDIKKMINLPPGTATPDATANPIPDQNAEYVYDPTSLRDPFFPEGLPQLLDGANPKDDKQKGLGSGIGESTIDMSSDPIVRYNLETYKAIAIVWNTNQPKAMVQSMNGSIYTVRIGTKIGKLGGKVAAIREKEIVVAEPVIEGGKQSYIYRKIELR